MSRVLLPSKTALESENFTFDFTSRLAAGETLSSASCAATVYSGVDASPQAIISGPSSISGAKVTQLIVAGVEGVIYDVACTALTSFGQTLVLPGFLTIVPNLT